jgi:hypothetical protein
LRGRFGAFGTAASSVDGADLSITARLEKIGEIGSFCMFTTISQGRRQPIAAR